MRTIFRRTASAVTAVGLAIACGGTAVDQTRSGHANEAGSAGVAGGVTGGAAGLVGSGGTSSGGGGAGGRCTSDSECPFRGGPGICIYTDAGRLCAIGPACVDGKCRVRLGPLPTDAGGFSGSGGRGGATGGTGGTSSLVSFEFDVAGPASYCRHGCVPPVIEIKPSGGSPLELGNSCEADCESCTRAPCPSIPCLPDEPITSVTGRWDGTYYTPGTCGSGTSCRSPHVAPMGTYVATVCITPGTMVYPDGGSPQCVVTSGEVCGSFDFEFPSNGLIIGSLGM